MKILNTIRKFFKNNELKDDFSISTEDNIYNKETKYPLDVDLDMLKRKDDDITKFVSPINYKLYNVTDQNTHFGYSQLTVSVIAGMCIISGRLATSQAVSGQEVIKLPTNLTPLDEYVGYGTVIVIDGTEYKIRLIIERDHPDQMVIYFYDEVPTSSSILINIVYPLSLYR